MDSALCPGRGPAASRSHVHFTPQSEQSAVRLACPLSAKSRHSQCSRHHLVSTCHSPNGSYGISARSPPQSALMLASRITLAHFSVSSAMSLPKSPGEPPSVVPPRSASCALILGSASAALISLLSFSIISCFSARRYPTKHSPGSLARTRLQSGYRATPPNASRSSPPALAACRP